MNTAQETKDMVRAKYAEIAKQDKDTNASSCCGAGGCSTEVYNIMTDDYSELNGYNADADLGLGCGLPTQFAGIKPGDTVLDLGSGAGNDYPANASLTAGTLVQVLPLDTKNWTRVFAGQFHTCATRADHTLWCWGRNASGELGVGNSVGPVLAPVQVGAASDWARPVLGQGTSTCALKVNGDLYCWGTGSYGQLGLGSLSSLNTPQKVPSMAAWARVSLGNEHACGIGADGRLSCWGASYGAQLGSGLPIVSTPAPIVEP